MKNDSQFIIKIEHDEAQCCKHPSHVVKSGGLKRKKAQSAHISKGQQKQKLLRISLHYNHL